MTLLDEVEEYFGTRILYDVIGVCKEASGEDIKKAYRKTSLKIHPDRVEESEKEKATKKFQVLAQVHHVLSDEERRKLYDDHGIIANEDNLESEADWSNYWRLLFPEITEKDVDSFMRGYIGSADEENDLIALYNRFEGDMDTISEHHIGYDEQRTTELLKKLIADKKIKNFAKFSKESLAKKNKRSKRASREAKQAEKLKEELKARNGSGVDTMDELTALIRQKQGKFDNMIANLEAKYSTNKGTKRKRGQR